MYGSLSISQMPTRFIQDELGHVQTSRGFSDVEAICWATAFRCELHHRDGHVTPQTSSSPKEHHNMDVARTVYDHRYRRKLRYFRLNRDLIGNMTTHLIKQELNRLMLADSSPLHDDWRHVLANELNCRKQQGSNQRKEKTAMRHEEEEEFEEESGNSELGIYSVGVFTVNEKTGLADTTIIDFVTVLASTEEKARNKMLVRAARSDKDFDSDNCVVVVRPV